MHRRRLMMHAGTFVCNGEASDGAVLRTVRYPAKMAELFLAGQKVSQALRDRVKMGPPGPPMGTPVDPLINRFT